MDQFDVVVVGGGLGGLSAGAILSKSGYKVHLIEPHDKVGGYASCFKRGKYRMEVAIHLVEGSHPQHLRNEIFEFLEVDKHVTFVSVPEFYKCHSEGESFALPGDLETARAALIERFPREREGLEEYFRLMRDICRQVFELAYRNPRLQPDHPLFSALYPDHRKYRSISAGHYLWSLFKDPFLKQVLQANVSFHHDSAYELNLLQFLLAQGYYFLGGTKYIQGGSQVFSNYLAGIIEANGGQVSLKHEVQALCVENGRVNEITYAKVVGDKQQKSCRAKFVVANAPMPLVYKKLLQPKVESPAFEDVDKLGYSTSATKIYFGLKKSLRHLGNDTFLNVFYEEKRNSQNFSAFDNSIGVVDYDMIDSRLCREGTYSTDIMFVDRLANWSRLNDEEYKTKKRVIREFYTSRLERYFPGFRDAVDICEVGTPRSIVNFTSNTEGACYGFIPSCESFSRRFGKSLLSWTGATPEIENLHFASAWSSMPGFSSAVIAGSEAAKNIMQVKTLFNRD